jgi:hypothetical protein
MIGDGAREGRTRSAAKGCSWKSYSVRNDRSKIDDAELELFLGSSQYLVLPGPRALYGLLRPRALSILIPGLSRQDPLGD